MPADAPGVATDDQGPRHNGGPGQSPSPAGPGQEASSTAPAGDDRGTASEGDVPTEVERDASGDGGTTGSAGQAWSTPSTPSTPSSEAPRSTSTGDDAGGAAAADPPEPGPDGASSVDGRTSPGVVETDGGDGRATVTGSPAGPDPVTGEPAGAEPAGDDPWPNPTSPPIAGDPAPTTPDGVDLVGAGGPPPAPVLAPPPRPGRRQRRGRHATRDRGAKRGLRVTQRLWTVDVWSVFKVSALFYLCLGLVVLVAGTLLYNAGRSMGTIDQFESFVTRMGAYGECVEKTEVAEGTEFEEDEDACEDGQVLVGGFALDDGTLFRTAAIGGTILVVAGSIGNVLLTVLLNLLSELTGGVRHTIIKEPVSRPAGARRPPRPGPRRRPMPDGPRPAGEAQPPPGSGSPEPEPQR